MVSIERAVKFSELAKNYNSLKDRVRLEGGKHPAGIVARSQSILAALDVARRVADSNANVLISGESGTGKEVIARYIHSESRRKDGPLIAINCSAIPENLLESELFGHAKGSFTGASEKKIGLFEEAEDGTISWMKLAI